MPTTSIEEIITKYTADEGDYVRGTERSIGASKRFAKAIDATEERLRRRKARNSRVQQGRFWQGVSGDLKSFKKDTDLGGFTNIGKMAIGSLAGLASGAALAGGRAMQMAADFDALTKSLEAVEGQGDRAKKVLKDLRELAKLPGLELDEAIQSYVNLRRSGMDEGFSKRILEQLGNANALSGGGQAEFGQIMRAINQIANKPFLQGDELVQLMEGGIPAYKLIKDIFGTTDTEELKRQGIDSRKVLEGLVAELAKMPRVGDNAKNSFENLWAAINQAFVTAGTALNNSFLPKIREVTGILEEMSDNGSIRRTFEDIAGMIGGVFGSGSTEDILYDMLAELKTMAQGFVNLAENSKGFVETISDLWESATKPRGGPDLEQWEKNRAEREQEAPSLMDLRRKFMDEAEMEKERAKKERERRKKESEAGNGNAPKPPSELVSPLMETAKNTAQIAQLQQKQVEISEAIIGGTGRAVFSPVELAGLKRGGGKSLPTLISLLTTAVYQEGFNAAMGVQLDMARRGQFRGSR